jgi:cell division protein FtsZ
MSLAEVNEALTVIQEAAHEDANIIFGAVIDTTLNGRVKITVIATGFDLSRALRSTSTAAISQTPVDLQSYTGHVPGRPSPAAAPPAAPPVPATPSRLTITRRPALELPTSHLRPTTAGSTGESAPGARDTAEGGEGRELDVPAFLRRHEG